MLYVTTRNHQEAFTANHCLTQNRGTDGGLYVPLKFPKFSAQDLLKLSQMSFGQCTAEILNLFFTGELTGWDVDFSAGRYPVRLKPLAHRIFLAETWHNPDGIYQRFERNMMDLLHSEVSAPGNWVSLAVRMSVLAGLCREQEILGSGPVDIACITGDFTDPICAWYLRKIGFPVGNIICCCNENNQLWELICNGQIKTDSQAVSTIVPEADITLPENLERLISDCGGVSETVHYLDCCRTGSVYSVSETLLQQMRRGLYVSVVSSSRVENTISNVYKTHNSLLSPASALAYSGLMDYRTKTGITRPAIVLSDKSPVYETSTIARIMDIPVSALKKLL